MSGRDPREGELPVTRSELVRDLRALGVREGTIAMVHTRMRQLGWVVGGPETVVRALLDVVGPSGTLMAYAGWDQDPYHLERWPPEIRERALEEHPGFDPQISEANREHGRLPERMRTWPGAVRGPHPESGMVAIGHRAAWAVAPHPDDDAYGAGSPLERLVDADGQVLMLGAPLGTITLLHHAEAIAPVGGKARVTYREPLAVDGGVEWRTYHDFDTSGGAFDYASVLGEGVDEFEAIATDALAAGAGRSGPIAGSTSHVFEARSLVGFAVAWLEARFGRGGAQPRSTSPR